jgi:hypothetical protein
MFLSKLYYKYDTQMAEKAVPPKIRHRLASFLSFTGATANQVIKLVVYSTVLYSII